MAQKKTDVRTDACTHCLHASLLPAAYFKEEGHKYMSLPIPQRYDNKVSEKYAPPPPPPPPKAVKNGSRLKNGSEDLPLRRDSAQNPPQSQCHLQLALFAQQPTQNTYI